MEIPLAQESLYRVVNETYDAETENRHWSDKTFKEMP